MATYYPSTPFPVQFINPDTGELLSGGVLRAYLAGTTTPTPMYTNGNGTSAGTSVTLNAGGYPTHSDQVIVIWLEVGIDYKFVLEDDEGGGKWSVDNILSITNSFLASNVFGVCKTVADMKSASGPLMTNGQRLTGAMVASAANTGAIIRTAMNNTASRLGGKDYEIKTLEQHRLDISDPAWVPQGYLHHYLLGGTTYIVVAIGMEASLDECGIARDGTVDSVGALNEIVENGLTVRQYGGSFLYSQHFYIPSNARIYLEDGAEFVRSTDVRFRAGNSDTRTVLTATGTWDINGRVIQLDSSSYSAVSVGDRLYIETNTPSTSDYIVDFVATPNVIDDWVYQVQTPKILEKLGSNQILLSEYAKVTFDFGGDAKLGRMDDVVDKVRIKANFRNISETALASTEAAFIHMSAVYGLDISGCQFFMENKSPGVYITVGHVESIQGARFYDGRNLDIFLRRDCPNSKLIGAEFYNHRTNDASIFIEAHNYNITITGNSFSSAIWDPTTSVISAIQMDAKVNNCTITGNQVFGYPIGIRIEMGSFQNTITGNTFQMCEISGIRSVSARSNTITGNTFIDCGLSDTAHVVLSQQQGGIYVNGTYDTVITGNTFIWIAPAFNNFCCAIAGGMFNGVFSNNTVRQAQRAIWLNGGGGNIIEGNQLDVDDSAGNDYVVFISGTGNHYNKIRGNIISGNGTADSGAIVISTGSEGNEIVGNECNDVIYMVELLSVSNYQSIRGNYGNGSLAINVSITAPELPANATIKRDFTIYAMEFTATDANGLKYWQYKQGATPNARFIEFDLTSLTSVVLI